MKTSMRTIPVSLLAVGIAAASLTGCGSKASDSSSTPSSSTTVATATPGASAGATSAAASSPAASAPATSASAAAQAPAGMKLVTGKGYTVAIPEAWQKGTTSKPTAVSVGDINYGVVQGAALLPSMNVQLITKPATAADLGAIREGELSQLANNGGKEVLELDSTIDGERAVGAAGLMTVSGKQIRIRQLTTIHAGKAYAVSVVMPSSASNADVKALMEKILATWKWTA